MYDARFSVKIEYWDKHEYKYLPYMELESSYVDYRAPQPQNGWAPDAAMLFANPVKRTKDEEGDNCKILAIDIYGATTDLVFYPRLVIQGFVPTMKATEEPQVDHWFKDNEEPVYKYTPDTDPEWKGRLAKITIMPTALWQVEEEEE